MENKTLINKALVLQGCNDLTLLTDLNQQKFKYWEN